MSEPRTGSPEIQITRGEPSETETAALVAVLVALSQDAPDQPAQSSAWADPAYRLRVPLHPGSDAWRSSALPGRL